MGESEKKLQVLNEEFDKRMEEYQEIKKMYEQADKRNLQKMEYDEILSIASTMTKLEKNLDKYEEIVKKYKNQQQMYEEYKAKENEAYELLKNFHKSENYNDLTIRKIKEQEYRTKLSMYKNFSNDMFNELTNLKREIVSNYKFVTNKKELELLKKYSYNSEIEENSEQLLNNPENIENQNDIDNNYRDLTLEEAEKLVEYDIKYENKTITEEDEIMLQPIIEDLMKKTGIDDVEELYDRANEIVNNNIIKERNSIENPAKFVADVTDVSQLTEEQSAIIRNKLGLAEETSLENDDLNEMGTRLMAEQPLKEEPEKKTLKERFKFKVSKIGQALENLDNAIAKNTGKAVMAAIAIGAVALTGGVALSAAGLTVGGAAMLGGAGVAYQEFNKGKKL